MNNDFPDYEAERKKHRRWLMLGNVAAKFLTLVGVAIMTASFYAMIKGC